MSIAQETPVTTRPTAARSAPRNGRWAGYSHLLMARMLELKREPEVVFWVFVFPLLLALGLGIAFRNKPADAVRVAIVAGAAPKMPRRFSRVRPSMTFSKCRCLPPSEAQKGFRLGKFDLVIEPDGKGGVRIPLRSGAPRERAGQNRGK